METDDQDDLPSLAESNTDPVEEELPRPHQPSRRSKWWSKVRWRAHCLLPDFVPDPHGSDESYTLSRGEKENEKSRVRLDRELRCAMVWGVELYGPDEIQGLYAGLTKLGWSRVGGSSIDNAAANRVRQMRAHGAGSWMNIGHVYRRGEDVPFLMGSNFASLPIGVETLLVGVVQITSSMTAVHIGFRLEDSLARRYESEINTDRRTIRRRTAGAWTMEWWDPIHQKHQAVSQVRQELRQMIGTWFARHLPGYFCATHPPSTFPTMELLVARGLELRDPDDRSLGGWENWRRLLTQDALHEVWTIDEYPGLQLAFERHRDEDTGLHLLVSLNPKVFPEEATRHAGGSKVSAYGWVCNEMLGGTLVHSATIHYLNAQKQNLHRVRERMKKARSARRHVSRTLNEIGMFFDRTLGSPAILRELAKHSEQVGWYRHDCEKFTTQGWAEADKPKELPEAIRATVHRISTQLTEEEAALRGHFEQLASILSVRESIRAQRWMFGLTIVALVVALASLVVASLAIPNAAAILQSLTAS